MAPIGPTIHGSAVQVGEHAILIRGPSGSGKSRLAFDLILAGRAGQIADAILVGDDRVHLARQDDMLTVSPAEDLAGLIEIRGLGIRRLPFVQQATVGIIVDLDVADAARMPAAESLQIEIEGVMIPRIPVGRGYPALPLVVANLLTEPWSILDARPSNNCR